MSAPSISLLGATYSDVAGVTLPKSGGGTATFPWVEGSQTINANGTVDVTSLAEVVVAVSGGGGCEYETGTYTPTADIARPSISFSKTHSTTPILIAMHDVSGESTITQNSNLVFVYYDAYRMWGIGFPQSTSARRVATAYFTYKTSSSISNSGTVVTYNSDNAGSSDKSYSRYWATESGFHPYSNENSRYWRKNRDYKWIAIWKATS